MKIVMISNLYPPYIFGGAEVYVKRISEDLVARGHEVVIITTSPTNKFEIEKRGGVKIYRINTNLYPLYERNKHSLLIRVLWRGIDMANIYSLTIIKRVLKKEVPDIVHIHNFRGLSILSFKATKDLNLPTIFTAHDYSLMCPKSSLLRRDNTICENPRKICQYYKNYNKYITNARVNLITAPSQFVLNKIRESGLFKGTLMIKLPLGIKLDNRKLKKSYDKIDILFVGNLGWHKGVHILINAFKQIERSDITLHIVGKGEAFRTLKKIAGDDPRIIFYGFVPDNKLDELYTKANIGVIPSIWYDNSPVVIYENLSHGNPVIGSKIGGIPELIEENYNGFLFEAGNVNELKEKLEYLINNRDILKKFSQNAVRYIKKYDMTKHINSLIRIYKEVIERSGNHQV